MKRTNKKEISNLEVVVRLLGGLFLILLGIAIIALHLMKVVPAGWETSNTLSSITLVWAYAGFFLGPIAIMAGLWISRVFHIALKLAEKKGWL